MKRFAYMNYFGILLLQHLSLQGSLLWHRALPILTGCFLMASLLLLHCLAFVPQFPEYQFPCLYSWGLCFNTAIDSSIPLHSQSFLKLHSLVTVNITHLWGSILIASISCVTTLNVFILSCGSPPSWARYFRSFSVRGSNYLEFTDFSSYLSPLLHCHTLCCDSYLLGSICHYFYWEIITIIIVDAQYIKTGY